MRRLLHNRWVPIGLSVALVIVLAVEIAALGDSDGPDAPAASRDVAREFAVAMTSFDHRHIDADVERALSFVASDGAADIRRALGKDFVEGTKRGKRITVGRVLYGPTVQRVADGSAAFVVVAQQTVSAGDADEPPQSLTQSMLITVTTGESPKVTALTVL